MPYDPVLQPEAIEPQLHDALASLNHQAVDLIIDEAFKALARDSTRYTPTFHNLSRAEYGGVFRLGTTCMRELAIGFLSTFRPVTIIGKGSISHPSDHVIVVQGAKQTLHCAFLNLAREMAAQRPGLAKARLRLTDDEIEWLRVASPVDLVRDLGSTDLIVNAWVKKRFEGIALSKCFVIGGY